MPVEPTTLPHTILLKGDEATYHEEYYANAALKPGHALEIHSNGKCKKHVTAAGDGVKMFAKEQVLIGYTIDTAYAEDDLVPVHVAQAGDRIYALVAAGAT